jgi:hypothetical protein
MDYYVSRSNKGLDLIIQLKSSKLSNSLNDKERQSLKISTYNYLNDNLRVVMPGKSLLRYLAYKLRLKPFSRFF